MRTASILLSLALLPSLALAAEIPKGTYQLITKGTDGSPGTDHSFAPAISSNGKMLSIASTSSNFGPGTYNAFRQVMGFKRNGDMLGPIGKMVGGQLANDDCRGSQLSKSGRYVAFECESPLGLSGPPGGSQRVFWRDTKTGELRHVSIGPNGNVANEEAYLNGISDDGRFVLFRSTATNMVANETTFKYRGYLHDTKTGTTELVTVNDQEIPINGDLWHITMSGNARFVYLASNGPNLGSGSSLQVYVRDRKLGTTKLITQSDAGVPGATASYLVSCSRNGRFVLIFTTATNLGFPLKPGGLVLFDRMTSDLRPIDISMPGMSDEIYADRATISNDGRRMMLIAQYDNAENGVNIPGIFDFDLKTGARYTVVSNPGSNLNLSTMYAAASATGEWVFLSTSVGLQESNGKWDGYLYRAH